MNSQSQSHSFLRLMCLGLGVLICPGPLAAAERYIGTVQVRFDADSTLHAFFGDTTNLPVVVTCSTNTEGTAGLHMRLEIAPQALTTHHAKRDKNMYAMFQAEHYPKLLVVVSNAPLAAARLTPPEAGGTNGVIPVQLTFAGRTKEVAARIVNQLERTDGWEFDLQADLSLKAFQLKPASAVFGMISVADGVAVKAHVAVTREKLE